jgi:hypothetical protein
MMIATVLAAALVGPPASAPITPADDGPHLVRVESRRSLYLQFGLPAAIDLASTEVKLVVDPTALERNVLFGQDRARRVAYNAASTVVGAELARFLESKGCRWGATVLKGASFTMHGAGIVLTWR